MTILVCCHFGSFVNFKHYYLFYIRRHLFGYFPDVVSYNRFVELMPRYVHKVFKGMAADGKGTMRWCHGFKLHLLLNLDYYMQSFFDCVASIHNAPQKFCV